MNAPSSSTRVDRTQLPAPGPAPAFAFPAIEKSTLSNGLQIWTARHAQIPVVSFSLLIRHGSADDPPGKQGLAALTIDMLDEGTGALSAIAVHEALARLGAQLDVDTGSDAALVGVTVLARYAERVLGLLADIVVRPALREEDVSRVRQLRLHRLTQLRDIASSVADRGFTSIVYGSHPYAHPPIGIEPGLLAISPDDVRGFHARAIEPSSVVLIAVGDCTHDEVRRLAANAFDGWQGQSSSRDTAPPPTPAPPRMNIINWPGAAQSEIRLGHVAVGRDTPDYHALVVGNMVLGGQFVSRINLNLRQDKGITYGARTSFDFRRWPGPFLAQAAVDTRATATAIREVAAEIEGIRGARPITREELEIGSAALTRGYPRNFETAEQIARAITQLVLYGLPDDYYDQFVPAIERITPADAAAAMARHIDPARLVALVVGDADSFGSELQDLGLGDPALIERS
jgi:predicted Zn-dependent peptidase